MTILGPLGIAATKLPWVNNATWWSVLVSHRHLGSKSGGNKPTAAKGRITAIKT